MEQTKQKLRTENIGAGLLYFYIHFVTEVLCFFMLESFIGDSVTLYLVVFAYDMLAFVPQGLLGYFADRHRAFPLAIVGLALMSAALAVYRLWTAAAALPVSLVLLCIGNCCTHINGAEVTLRASKGKLSHSAIFVSGGSFGVISGKLLAAAEFPWWILPLLAASAVPFAVLAQYYIPKNSSDTLCACDGFSYRNKKIGGAAVILLAAAVVAVRGYIGYGIPTAWNKTTIQTVFLYVAMGIGKALGGIVTDCIGIRRTATLSSLLALPFLLCGNQLMGISLIGVLLFSMTMPITLALIVSAIPKEPGLAFGLTTLGLFIGTAPIFFFKFASFEAGCIIIGALTLLCTAALYVICEKGREKQ